jgi:indole-3-glycerol phosphate synthase
VASIFDRIVAAKRVELAEAQMRTRASALEVQATQAAAPRDFRAALERGPGVQVIAEVKKASPSAGILRANFDPVAQAQIYNAHGAACISVLTDGPFFQGSLADLAAVRGAVERPLLRKDFVLDRRQVLEARAAGADAVLLIAEILDDDALRRLMHEIAEWKMQALVELYDAENLPRVLGAGAQLVGVNNRDLRTLEVRLEHTLELAERMPKEVCLVSESGVRTRADVQRLGAAGVRAVLVGETLMRADDPGATLRELLGS